MADMVLLRSTMMLFVILLGVIVVQMQMTSVVPLVAAARVLAEANHYSAGVKVGAKAGSNGVGVRVEVSAKAGGNKDEPIVGGGGAGEGGYDYDFDYGGGK